MPENIVDAALAAADAVTVLWDGGDPRFPAGGRDLHPIEILAAEVRRLRTARLDAEAMVRDHARPIFGDTEAYVKMTSQPPMSEAGLGRLLQDVRDFQPGLVEVHEWLADEPNNRTITINVKHFDGEFVYVVTLEELERREVGPNYVSKALGTDDTMDDACGRAYKEMLS